MERRMASAVSARVGALIARYHGGDRAAAAQQLGIELTHLNGLLSGDWGRFSLGALASLVPGYGVSLDWLLAPSTRASHIASPGGDASTNGRDTPRERPVISRPHAHGERQISTEA